MAQKGYSFHRTMFQSYNHISQTSSASHSLGLGSGLTLTLTLILGYTGVGEVSGLRVRPHFSLGGNILLSYLPAIVTV